MRERVPTAGSACRGGAAGIAGQEGSNGGFVGQESSGVDAAPGDVRVSREDHLSFLDCARAVPVPGHARGFNKRRGGLIEQGYRTGQPERFDMFGELRPAFEAVLPGYDKLRIREPERRGADDVARLLVESGAICCTTTPE